MFFKVGLQTAVTVIQPYGVGVVTMILAVAATQMEMNPFLKRAGEPGDRWKPLVSGVGPLETAVRLSSCLAAQEQGIEAVLQFGVGGAYMSPGEKKKVPLLGVCLATREVMGDFGICFSEDFEYFPDSLGGAMSFSLESPLLVKVTGILERNQVEYHSGTFVTVNAISGTAGRGEIINRRWNGICENMEGGAAARVCREYNLPLLEIRAVSNMVEDRDPEQWKLQEACDRAGEVAALLLKELL